MSAPPVPPFLEHLGRRPFAFYPAILNIPNNKWFYRRATWSEVLVENIRTHEQLWIPRRHFGEITQLGDMTQMDQPVIRVALLQQLEFNAGRLLPAYRHVIEMPRAVNESPRPVSRGVAEPHRSSVVNIRIENDTHSRVARLLLGGISLGIVGCVLLVSFYRGGILANRMMHGPALQSDLGLGAADDYNSVLRVLGRPTGEHWRSSPAGISYGRLAYPGRGLSVILRGPDRNTARYIGALDGRGKPLHAIELPGEGNSYYLLRSLETLQ